MSQQQVVKLHEWAKQFGPEDTVVLRSGELKFSAEEMQTEIQRVRIELLEKNQKEFKNLATQHQKEKLEWRQEKLDLQDQNLKLQDMLLRWTGNRSTRTSSKIVEKKKPV